MEPVPISYSETKKYTDKELSNQSMTTEYEGLKENEPFKYVAVPEDRKVVYSKWVSR